MLRRIVLCLVIIPACGNCGGNGVTVKKPEFSTEDQLRPSTMSSWQEKLSKWLLLSDAPEIAERPSRFKDWTAVVSFVHISDAQLRDSGVEWFGNGAVRKVADWVAPGVKRVAKLDQNDEMPLLALIGGMRDLRADISPAFVVHTGDATDGGTVGELVRFLWIMNHLKIPWFSTIGNHDVFHMGNFTHSCVKVNNSGSEMVPLIGDREKFMRHHGPKTDMPYAAPLHAATERGNQVVPAGSWLHGFDMGKYADKFDRSSNRPSPHYSLPLYTDPPLRIIVLDTTKPDENIPGIGCKELPSGHKGFLSEDNKIWLADQVDYARKLGEYVIIFGHHPLNALGKMPRSDGRTVLEYLVQQDRVLAYSGGHTHVFKATAHRREDLDDSDTPERKIFPEIIATAMRVDPPFGLLIEVLRKDEQLAIVYRSVSPKASGELGKKLNDFCKAAAKEDKKTPECRVSESGGYIVYTGVAYGPRLDPAWDQARDPMKLVSRTDENLGTSHGPGSEDPHPCISNDSIKTRTTLQIRNERDRTADLAFEVADERGAIVDRSVELPPGAWIGGDEPIKDGLDPEILPELRQQVEIGRRVTIRDVPARAKVTYRLEVCSDGVSKPVVKTNTVHLLRRAPEVQP